MWASSIESPAILRRLPAAGLSAFADNSACSTAAVSAGAVHGALTPRRRPRACWPRCGPTCCGTRPSPRCSGPRSTFSSPVRSNATTRPEKRWLEPAERPGGRTLLHPPGRGHRRARPGRAVGGAFQYEAGDLFPVARPGAARRHRHLPGDGGHLRAGPAGEALARSWPGRSPEFADFLHRRVASFLDLSRRALQAAYASQTLAEQSLETPLGELAPARAVTCAPDTPLRDGARADAWPAHRLHRRDEAGRAAGASSPAMTCSGAWRWRSRRSMRPSRGDGAAGAHARPSPTPRRTRPC